jgi:prepilin-type N-terminal cleavage/methylation domain-containing protein
MCGSRKKGFTLIEVLVVVAIIGTLASLIYANFGSARNNARNKAMRTSLSEVQLALETYKAQYKIYPDTLTDLKNLNFISDLPTAAQSGNSACSITYTALPVGTATYYKLTAARCIAGATIATDDEFARCPTTCPSSGNCTTGVAAFTESLAIYSAGGQCL